jgi:serpin B/serpin B11/12
MYQTWAPCYDCFKQDENQQATKGACMHCLATCHVGHRRGALREGNFFCDCGAEKMCKTDLCCAMPKPMSFDELFVEMSDVSSNNSNCVNVRPVRPEQSTHTLQEFSKSNNSLACKLYDVMEDESVLSPLSIGYITSLLHLGSVAGTENELTALMGRKNSLEELRAVFDLFNSDVVNLANAILVNKNMPIEKKYLEMMQLVALVSNEDFNNAQAVTDKGNNFIEKNTRGLIKNIIKTDFICPDVVMVLINVIYFKTLWEKQFKAKNTRDALFNGNQRVRMMQVTHDFPYFENEWVQQVEMPYKGNQFCMGFILPKKETADLKDCLMNFHLLQKTATEVHIPKFTHRKNIDLVPLMNKLGVKHLFSSKDARLDAMTPVSSTHVSKMIHEAVVIVDEDGTEAAAVTVAVCRMESCCVKPQPKIFNANRRFTYYIRHMPTNMLLFVGDFNGN